MERQCPCYRFAVVDLSGEVYEGGFFLYAFQVRYLNQPSSMSGEMSTGSRSSRFPEGSGRHV